MPRATQDIDLVIAPNPGSLEALLKNFPEDQYYVNRDAAFDAYQRSSLFNVIDFASGWKIDFIVRKPRDFSRLEFDRRTPANVLGTTLFVASPEDVLISKLEWAKLANRNVRSRMLPESSELRDTTSTLPTSSIGPRISASRRSGPWRKQRQADYRATLPIRRSRRWGILR